MATPSSSGMTVSETTNSADGSTNSSRLPCSPRMSTWPTHNETHQKIQANIAGCQFWKPKVPETKRLARLGRNHEHQHEERSPDQDLTEAFATVGDVVRVDDVDEVGAAQVRYPFGCCSARSLGALRNLTGCAVATHPRMIGRWAWSTTPTEVTTGPVRLDRVRSGSRDRSGR